MSTFATTGSETGGDFRHRFGVCKSSPISWGAYAIGLMLALDPLMLHELKSRGPGLYVLLCGIVAFMILAARVQRQMRLPLSADHFAPPVELFTSGVFARTRNPIYVAFLIPLASLACFSPFAALVATTLYVTMLTAIVIRAEERDLSHRFGDAYRDYCRQVPRWLG